MARFRMLLESILSMFLTYPHTLLHFSLFFNLRWLIRSPIVRSQWLLHDSLNKIPSAISEGATSATSFFNDHLFCERFARLNPTILRGILGGAEYSHLYNPANSQVQDWQQVIRRTGTALGISLMNLKSSAHQFSASRPIEKRLSRLLHVLY